MATESAALSPLSRISWGLSVLVFLGSLVLGFYAYTREYQGVPWVNQNSFLMQGDQLLKDNRYDEAMAEYGSAKEIDRGNFYALYKYGFAAFLANEPEVALQSFRNAALLNPRCADCLHRIGLILMGQGQMASALEEMRKALAVQPDNAAILNDYGIGLARSGQYSAAAVALTRALEIQPDLPSARRNLATLNQMLAAGAGLRSTQ
jgi:tetratricopeptide (TPR) repeat protein